MIRINNILGMSYKLPVNIIARLAKVNENVQILWYTNF